MTFELRQARNSASLEGSGTSTLAPLVGLVAAYRVLRVLQAGEFCSPYDGLASDFSAKPGPSPSLAFHHLSFLMLTVQRR